MSNKATKEASVALEPVGKAQLSEAEAATLLGVSRSRIVQLGIGKRIRRRKVGGFWRYTRDSILEHKASRISAKTSKSTTVTKPVLHAHWQLTDATHKDAPLWKWAYSTEILKSFPISKSALSAAKLQGQIRHKVEEDGRLMYCVEDVAKWARKRKPRWSPAPDVKVSSSKSPTAPKKRGRPPVVKTLVPRADVVIRLDRTSKFLSVLGSVTEWYTTGIVDKSTLDIVVLDAIKHIFDGKS